MDVNQLASALSILSEPTVSFDDGTVVVFVPEIDDTLMWRVADTRRATSYHGPTGDLAVEFVVELGGEERPLILTDFDVVFMPHHDGKLDSRIPVVINGAPPLVAYSEMEDAAANLLHTALYDDDMDLDMIGANLILIRRFLFGAMSFGLRPVRTMSGWLGALGAVDGEIGIGMFRSDPRWESLAAAAEDRGTSPRKRTSPFAARESVGDVQIADFEAVAPKLTAVRLDEQYASLWRQHIPLSPKLFTEILTYRVPGASVEVTLGEDGNGQLTVTVMRGSELCAVVEMSFAKPSGTMNLDEVRVAEGFRGSGLFQKLNTNAEQLARRLGLSRITLLATDVGSVAFPTQVVPRDVAMYQKVWGRA
ncbi:GNAT family N-acetyltransferase [Stackebrandtia soli]|uniref:GNAT family N-acetyltransferase n=1 Tax=Stackebrandtia soli TaxID=1892856 RepID=UPI0039E94A7A